MKKIGKLGGKDGDGRFSFMMVQIRLTMLATLLLSTQRLGDGV
jgi:hypothetical protein